MKTLPGIPKVIEEMPFPENDQQIVTHETAPPDIRFVMFKFNKN
jgi:hypothetical protein